MELQQVATLDLKYAGYYIGITLILQSVVWHSPPTGG